ncbi:MAG TPA: N-formylglutamate amidohydrolase [Steroidobacteraceae bacterium]|jgi:predicted N-formylglutamate amidohydrolase
MALGREAVTALAEEAAGVVEGTARPDIVLLCEHAGRTVPAPWGDLGLPGAFFATHHACDLGAAELTRAVARELGATAILARYSRLFLDYNRQRDDPECRRIEIGGVPVPANLDLTEEEVEMREAIARAPLERAVALWTEQRPARAVISIHSFSPYWSNARRDCEIGVMWREDARLAPRLIAQLAQGGTYVVRDNEPYDFRGSDWFTLQRHGLEIGLPCAYIEVRNDLIGPAQREPMAEYLASAISKATADTSGDS